MVTSLAALLPPSRSAFPRFSGNHETRMGFFSDNGYQDRLIARVKRVGAQCSGEAGINTICSYKGLVFLLSSLSQMRGHEANLYGGSELWLRYMKVHCALEHCLLVLQPWRSP